jgi:ABC-type multidrug transport system fused ATPase/permease subunit
MVIREKLRGLSIALVRVLKVLSKKDRKKVLQISIIQALLGLMDLAGIALIGVIGALAVRGIQSNSPSGKINQILEIMGISNFSFQIQSLILGLSAAFVLVCRTLLSFYFTRRSLKFLSNAGAKISDDLVKKFLAQPMQSVGQKPMFESMYFLTTGVWVLTNEVIGTLVLLTADISMLLIISIGLIVIDPGIAIATIVIFGFVGISAYRLIHHKARMLGEQKADLEITSNQRISEVLESLREITVRNLRYDYAQEIGTTRTKLAGIEAEYNLMPYMTKYVLETTVVVGGLALSAVQFMINDALHAISVLTVFLAAGTRIAPGVLRIQQGAITIRARTSQALGTLELIETLTDSIKLEAPQTIANLEHIGFDAKLSIKNLSIKYQGSSSFAISDIGLDINQGEFVALVGPSGAGKSTLVDSILGLHVPVSGSVSISGNSPSDAISKFPGAIGYVPQKINLLKGSVRENILLSKHWYFSDDDIWRALRISQLSEFVESLQFGLDTPLVDSGLVLSGGQLQRIGIARAVVTNPKLLILDEATSSLDAQTELEVGKAIQALKGDVTMLVIAHRLSSVRGADSVVYLDHGKVVASGTFEEVRNCVADFDNQANLMGL